MVNHFFLSESEYNERLIKILQEKVINEQMDERTAIKVAKDMWKPVKGKLFSSNKLNFAAINEDHI